jgi:hypothetical protein
VRHFSGYHTQGVAERKMVSMATGTLQ